MPTPRKERFLHCHGSMLDVPFIMGVGGSVDVLAGAVSRAPPWMQSCGLEWLHRLVQEPRKMFWRYASSNLAFALLIAQALARRLAGREAISLSPGR
jgi:N-acetylglucosaminyldiphosphoundecaprenol N-acetyl-beta-D-mannosaminyltransferase